MPKMGIRQPRYSDSMPTFSPSKVLLKLTVVAAANLTAATTALIVAAAASPIVTILRKIPLFLTRQVITDRDTARATPQLVVGPPFLRLNGKLLRRLLDRS